ncbi:ATP-binding protein [Streptomyces polygonati]|uniref:ATP-binding protein n=1 Tax=Streptomyces polygonati TaxID=1617087 RepID=A0ABV8HVK0_9ACTN
MDTTELAVSELVSDAVRHVTDTFPESPLTRVVLTLRMECARLIVEVADASDRLSLISDELADASEGGRGLYIVQAISKEWGSYPPADGRQSRLVRHRAGMRGCRNVGDQQSSPDSEKSRHQTVRSADESGAVEQDVVVLAAGLR